MNWDKYQARTDKDLPWCKLWGTLFDRPWFQKLPDGAKFFALVMLDLARKTGNRIGEEYVFIDYLKGNYGILSTKKDVFMYAKMLSINGFLSDNMSDIQEEDKDKIEIRVDKIAFAIPPKEEVITYFKELGKTEEIALSYHDYYSSNGWKVGGRASMKDWKASARNWARNSNKFDKTKPQYASTKIERLMKT